MQSIDNHRARQERRRSDAGPPNGCSERRRTAERRLPELKESALSDADWQKYFGAPLSPSEKSEFKMFQAVDLLGRTYNA